MRLISCYIEGFGKLRKLEIKFEDGLNCFVKENGWGKSTFAAFLRVMFYGFEGETKRNEFENERKYYRPWAGDVYGGELVFETDGRTYRIQRVFGTKKSDDESVIYDVETNLPVSGFSDNIGEELFQLDSVSFQRTVYIGQNECETSSTDGINAKIGNISEGTADINNYDEASARLKAVINGMSPNKKTGELYKRKKELSELKERVRRTGIVESRIQKLRERRESIGKMRSDAAEYQYNVAERERAAGYFPGALPDEKELQEKIDRARELEKMKARLDTVKMPLRDRERCEELMSRYFPYKQDDRSGIHMPSDMELDKCSDIWNEIRQNRQEIDRLNRQLANVDRTSDKAVPGYIAEEKKTYGRKISGVCAVLAIVVFVGTLFLRLTGVITVQIMALGFVAAVIAGVLGIIIRNGNRAGEHLQNDMYSRLGENAEDSALDVEDHTSLYKEISELIELDKREIEENIKKLQSVTTEYGLHLDLDNFGGDIDQIRELVDLNRRQKALSRAQYECGSVREEICLYIECLGFEPAEDVLSQLIEIQGRLNNYNDRCMAVSGAADRIHTDNDVTDSEVDLNIDSRIAECDVELADLIGELEDIKDIAVQLEQKQPEFDCDIKRYELVSKTYDLLGQAKEKFTARYTEPVKRAFDKYYLCVSDKENDMQMNSEMDISYRDQGMYRDKKTLSAGLKDLTDVCIRAALVDVMYQGERPVLIMDDPFVNLDDRNMVGAVRLMSLLEEKYQIIYFTCSQNRVL